MKCDELKPLLFSLNELSFIDESAVQKNFENPHDHAVYKATEVDAAITELKQKLQDQCISCPVKMQEDDVVAELKAKLAEQEAEFVNKKKINAFDCICVTDVRISPIKQIEGLTHTKALAEIVFNDQLLIRGIRVVEGENGLYISYPYPFHTTTGEDGQQRSSVFPITTVLRDNVEAVVLEKYNDTVNNEKVTNK